MHLKSFATDWQKVIWKIVRNPAFEVVAAIVVVLFATGLVIQTEAEQKHTVFPVPFGHNQP